MVGWLKRWFAPSAPQVVRDVRAQSLTYLDERALCDLYETVRSLEQRGVPGRLLEAGCALGGSAIVIAAAKAPTRLLQIYDVFGMIPPPTERDGADVHQRYEEIKSGQSQGIGGNRYYGYEENLLAKVQENFRRFGLPPENHQVEFIQGRFQDTMHIDGAVAFAHIDADWYDSVWTCLERIAPKVSPGGVLVIDDYQAWSGCRPAVDDYFRDKRVDWDFVQRARLNIVRRAS